LLELFIDPCLQLSVEGVGEPARTLIIPVKIQVSGCVSDAKVKCEIQGFRQYIPETAPVHPAMSQAKHEQTERQRFFLSTSSNTLKTFEATFKREKTPLLSPSCWPIMLHRRTKIRESVE
ncbi:hypothetical protein RvY_03975-2, partial [Ramazzottius varieornatus]